MDPEIVSKCDEGKAFVAGDNGSKNTTAFKEITEKILA
jgi:hypothetical protein